MAWTGYITLLLVLVGSLNELDRDELNLQIADNYPEGLDSKSEKSLKSNESNVDGYASFETKTPDNIPSPLNEASFSNNTERSGFLIEQECYENEDCCDGDHGFQLSEEISPVPTCLSELQHISEIVEKFNKVKMNHPENLMCPFNGGPIDRMHLEEEIKTPLTKDSPVENNPAADGSCKIEEYDLDEVNTGYGNSSIFEMDNNLAAEYSKVLNHARELDGSEDDQTKKVHNSKERVSIADNVYELIYDHVIEPVDQWWKDDWIKYLKKYIRDIKCLLTGLGSFVKTVLKKMAIIYTHVSFAFCDSAKSFVQMVCETSEDIKLTFHNILSGGEILRSDVYNYTIHAFSECYLVLGRMRLAIRHFMHDKEFRFNYFWYVFYTICNALGMILYYRIVKKSTKLCISILACVFKLIKSICYQSRKVSVAVGTDAHNPSSVAIRACVLRDLREAKETEMERLKDIKALEDELENAREIYRMCSEKIEVLVEQIKSLERVEEMTSDRCSEMNEEMAEQINNLKGDVNEVVPEHGDGHDVEDVVGAVSESRL